VAVKWPARPVDLKKNVILAFWVFDFGCLPKPVIWRNKKINTKCVKKKIVDFSFSLSEVLDGLFCELEASSVTWTYFMEA
jgi:hypothetical protein